MISVWKYRRCELYLIAIHDGYVELTEAPPSELKIAKIARISHLSQSQSVESDKKLIKKLMQWGHMSPFEHISLTFKVKAPIFVARQWFRHRIGSFMERSGRYTTFDEVDFYLPDDERANGKQFILDKSCTQSFQAYHTLIKAGVDPEVARMVLPMSTYTVYYWTVNLRSLMNFLNLRASSHAQREMQEYAQAVAKIFHIYLPTIYDAFIKYRYTGDLLTQK